jgi:hypothetical protein
VFEGRDCFLEVFTICAQLVSACASSFLIAQGFRNCLPIRVLTPAVLVLPNWLSDRGLRKSGGE